MCRCFTSPVSFVFRCRCAQGPVPSALFHMFTACLQRPDGVVLLYWVAPTGVIHPLGGRFGKWNVMSALDVSQMLLRVKTCSVLDASSAASCLYFECLSICVTDTVTDRSFKLRVQKDFSNCTKKPPYMCIHGLLTFVLPLAAIFLSFL